MKKLIIAIAIATIYLIIFQWLIQLNSDIAITLSMFLFAPAVIIYMVYAVLKYGKPSKYTFDERFYDDWDYTRNVKDSVS
ncbi:MAG: hypothetical protein ABI358_13695 [Ginsengibacter sp.]